MRHPDSTPTRVDIRPRTRRWPAVVVAALAFALASALLVGQGLSIRAAHDCRKACRDTGAAVMESCARAAAVCSAAATKPAVETSTATETRTEAGGPWMWYGRWYGQLNVLTLQTTTAPTHKAAHRRQPKPTPPTDPVEDDEVDPMRLRAEDF